MSLSNPAKLLAGYMKATGISDAKVIAETLGIPLRTIQRLKLDVACANSANDATDGASENATSAMDGVDQTPKAPQVASRARVEDNNINTTLEDTPVGLESSPLTPQVDWKTMFADPAIDHGVEVKGGKVVLVNGTRADWLQKFGGDEEALELALTEAQGWIQINSGKPLKPQIERGLARIVREKREKDERYAKAAERNAKKPDAPTKKTASQILAEKYAGVPN